jgi:predicted RNA-binding protein YlqC (UPF0109 family)
MKNAAQFLEDILRQVVSNPEEVKITQNDTALEVKANSGDLGVIIGKGGKNIRAFKSLVNLKTAKEGSTRLDIKINEEEKRLE